MKIMIITDAWDPQVNGVVRTLKQTREELIGMGHEVEMIRQVDLNLSLAQPTQILPSPSFLGRKFLEESKHLHQMQCILLLRVLWDFRHARML